MNPEKIKEVLLKAKQKPSFFASHFLIGKDGGPLKLEKQQELFVNDPSPFRIFFASRRSGKSIALSVDILHTMFFNKDYHITCLAPTLNQSKEFATVFGDLIDRSPLLGSSVVVNNKMEKKLTNRSRVSFLTAGSSSGNNEDSAVVGRSPDELVLDEMQSTSDETLGTIMPAAIGQRKQMKITQAGTPRARSGMFYDSIKNARYLTEYYNNHYHEEINPNGRYSLHKFKITETDADGNVLFSRSPRVSIDDLETIKETIGLQKFQREFELAFLDASTIVYNDSLIQKQGILPEPKIFFNRNVAVGGIDIGKQRNNTVLSIATYENNVWQAKYFFSWELGTKYRDIENWLKMTLPKKFPNFKVLSVDQTGVGNAIYEDLENSIKNYLVEGVIFSQPSKVSLAEGCVSKLENDMLRFYPHKTLLREMKDYNRTLTDAGRIVYEKGVSDDFIDSFNLLSNSIDIMMNKGFLYHHTHSRPWVSSLGINSKKRTNNVGGLKQKRIDRRGKAW